MGADFSHDRDRLAQRTRQRPGGREPARIRRSGSNKSVKSKKQRKFEDQFPCALFSKGAQFGLQ